MKTFSAVRFGLACALVLGLGSSALAQEWHESDQGTPASLPGVDNDGPGNRMGKGSCEFVLDRGGNYSASLLVYQSGPMNPYSAAQFGSGRWDILRAEGVLDDYQFEVKLTNQCADADDPTLSEPFDSDWTPLTLSGWSEPFECPADMPVLVQATCSTRAYW